MFLNFTNHLSVNWTKKQQKAAEKYGKIKDIPFPAVPPCASADEVRHMAAECVDELLSWNPDVVLCQGEFSLAFHVIRLLKEHSVKVVAATSKRQVQECYENGITQKNAVFVFVQFREY